MTTKRSMPMSPSTDWKEEIEPGEQELFERFARDVVVPRQKEVAQRAARPMQRCLHYKPHAGLMAEFEVLPNLPESSPIWPEKPVPKSSTRLEPDQGKESGRRR